MATARTRGTDGRTTRGGPRAPHLLPLHHLAVWTRRRRSREPAASREGRDDFLLGEMLQVGFGPGGQQNRWIQRSGFGSGVTDNSGIMTLISDQTRNFAFQVREPGKNLSLIPQ